MEKRSEHFASTSAQADRSENVVAHTPGPWKDGPVFQKEGRAIFITDESKPGKWQRRLDDKGGAFSAADAKLIAAAPDLLAALLPFAETEECGIGVMIEEGNEPHNSGCEECRNVLAARAAIAKARG
jgi:hypothetical protein